MGKVESWDIRCRLNEIVSLHLQHALNLEVLLQLTNQLMGLSSKPRLVQQGQTNPEALCDFALVSVTLPSGP